jgi:hypothetical protein
MASLYKRGNVFWMKYYILGNCYRISLKTKQRADALKMLKTRSVEPIGVFMLAIENDLLKSDIRDL